LLRVKADET
jgi:elongation factor G